jgi:hypothetical protein
MAEKQNSSETSPGIKHPLLVYRFIAGRYRPAGVLLFVMGLLALLPWLIPALRFSNAILNYVQLATLGMGALIGGAGLWILTIFMERRAYVQCRPEYLVIRTAFHTVAVAYQRFNTIQPVQVGRVFNIKEIKGRERTFIKPLAAETAVEALVGEFPVPEKRLRRHFSRFLLSPRDKAFLFIVPRAQQLSIELNTYIQRARDTRVADQQRYLDPIERLKYQNTSRLT